MFSSYLLSQENDRELIKIEEMDPTSVDVGCCSSDSTEDSKDVYTFCREEYMGDESEISSTQFPSETQLMFYERPHHTEKPCKCNNCDRQFTMKKYLRQHQTMHTGEKSNKCDIKQFSQSGDLKRHKVIRTGEKTFKCNECGKQFTQSRDLK